MSKQYFVNIATNKLNTVFYTGMTNDLKRRISQHKNKMVVGFTSKYNINKLVYYDVFTNPAEAISAEKKIKGWVRNKKLKLIENSNPDFKDLSL